MGHPYDGTHSGTASSRLLIIVTIGVIVKIGHSTNSGHPGNLRKIGHSIISGVPGNPRKKNIRKFGRMFVVMVVPAPDCNDCCEFRVGPGPGPSSQGKSFGSLPLLLALVRDLE